jgi:hypothetical protein
MTRMTNRTVLPTAFLLISIFTNCSSATELFEHKLDINPWQGDAEFHLFSQMPLTPHLPGNEGIEASGAGLFARNLLENRQCPSSSGYCYCTPSIPFKFKLN